MVQYKTDVSETWVVQCKMDISVIWPCLTPILQQKMHISFASMLCQIAVDHKMAKPPLTVFIVHISLHYYRGRYAWRNAHMYVVLFLH